MIEPVMRALSNAVPVPLVILLCWACVAVGILIGMPEAGPRRKKRRPAERESVSTAEPVTDEFEIVVEDDDPETYGRHAPPTRPIPRLTARRIATTARVDPKGAPAAHAPSSSWRLP